MDAILQLASSIATHATLVASNMAMGGIVVLSLLIMLMMNNPDVTMVTCLLLAYAISWHYLKPFRRVLRWYLFWPIGRVFYRTVKRPVRLFVGGIMARWKTGIVADKLNDALESLCYDEHIISPAEYRRLSNLLGKTMGLQDLMTRKLSNKKGIRRTVLENIGVIKNTPQVPGPPRVVKVDPTYDPKSGTVTSLAYLRSRRQSA